MQVSLETQDHKLTVPHVYSPNSIILESECFTFYSCPYIYEQDSNKIFSADPQVSYAQAV